MFANLVFAFSYAVTRAFSGFSQRSPAGWQLRVRHDQHRGLACLAAV